MQRPPPPSYQESDDHVSALGVRPDTGPAGAGGTDTVTVTGHTVTGPVVVPGGHPSPPAYDVPPEDDDGPTLAVSTTEVSTVFHLTSRAVLVVSHGDGLPSTVCLQLFAFNCSPISTVCLSQLFAPTQLAPPSYHYR